MQLDCSDEGSGDAVILIHGGASNNRQWKSLIADLKPYFRVIAPNLHGAGKTPSWQGPNAYRLADAAALIERVCESIVGGVSLVGHSVGGAFAMQAAAQLGARPVRVRARRVGAWRVGRHRREIPERFRRHGRVGEDER